MEHWDVSTKSLRFPFILHIVLSCCARKAERAGGLSSQLNRLNCSGLFSFHSSSHPSKSTSSPRGDLAILVRSSQIQPQSLPYGSIRKTSDIYQPLNRFSLTELDPVESSVWRVTLKGLCTNPNNLADRVHVDNGSVAFTRNMASSYNAVLPLEMTGSYNA